MKKEQHVSTNLYTSSDGETHSVTVYAEEQVSWETSFNADFENKNDQYRHHPKGELVRFSFDPHTKNSVEMGDRRDGIVHEVPTTYFNKAKKVVTVKFYTTTKKIDSQTKAR